MMPHCRCCKLAALCIPLGLPSQYIADRRDGLYDSVYRAVWPPEEIPSTQAARSVWVVLDGRMKCLK